MSGSAQGDSDTARIRSLDAGAQSVTVPSLVPKPVEAHLIPVEIYDSP